MAAEVTQISNLTPYMPLIVVGISAVVGSVSGLLTFGVKFIKLGMKVDSLEKLIHNQDSHIRGLQTMLARIDGGLERDRANWVQSKSPLTLTEVGQEVLVESRGKEYIDKHLQLLIDEVKKENPKTAYDVQELSQKIIQQHSNDDDFIPIKDYIFSKGKKLKNIIEVLGIYLRDIVLENLGFKVSDLPD